MTAALTVTTLQAPNQEFIIRDVADYVGKRLGIETRFIVKVPWQERERLFDAGEIDAAWLCGLPYVWKADQGSPRLELLAAPVMLGDRYQDRPVYFSDVIVREESAYKEFADLRETRWAFNEPNSHSGCLITRYHLSTLGENESFFGKVIEAGSHERSIEMIVEGFVDAAAIDSTVLDIALQWDGDLGKKIRIIETLGPSPIPSLVVKKALDPGLLAAVRETLVTMHNDDEGSQLLNKGNIKRLAPVSDEDYDPIRKMEQSAAGVKFTSDIEVT